MSGVKTRLARLEAGMALRRKPAPPEVQGVVRLGESEMKLLPLPIRRVLLNAIERIEASGPVNRDGACRLDSEDLPDGLMDRIEATLANGVWHEQEGDDE